MVNIRHRFSRKSIGRSGEDATGRLREEQQNKGGVMSEVSDAARNVLEEDLSLIREFLAEFSNYDFAADLRGRMKAMGISANAMAERTQVTHTAVGKWINGDARPQGKERVKMLGMALGFGVEELDSFLLENGYPKLYVKNPLDNVCRLIIKTYQGTKDIVEEYLELINRYHLKTFQPLADRADRPSADVDRSFEAVDSPEAFAEWMERNNCYFNASACAVTARPQLLRRIWLYIGESSISDLYAVGELPLPVRNLLYALTGNHEVAMKGLRNKLILFGLYENMTEEEINLLLEDANLRILSNSKTRLDLALLTAVRAAHDQYPYYEYETNLIQTNHIQSGLLLAKKKQPIERLTAMLKPYQERLKSIELRTAYYELHKTQKEEQFEELYTSRSDRGLMHYVYDILAILSEEQEVEPLEAQEFLALYSEQEG